MDSLADDLARRAKIEDDPVGSPDRQGSSSLGLKSIARGEKGSLLLENFPAEVRRNLLSVADLPCLKALVRASPIFHQQYVYDRQYILCRSLEQTLGSATVDAYAVHLYEPERSHQERYPLDFLKSYSDKLSTRDQRLVGKLAPEEACSMAAFYLHSVEPVAQRFIRVARQYLSSLKSTSDGTGFESAPNDDNDDVDVDDDALAAANSAAFPPSHTEMMRLSRALYRFHLLCELLPPGRETWALKVKRLQTMFRVLHPWETEEVFSVFQFAQNLYDRVFNDISWDVNADNPKFNPPGQEQIREGVFFLEDPFIRRIFLEGTTFRGLGLLRTVLFDIENHEHLVSTMQAHMVSECIPFNIYGGMMGEVGQLWTRENKPSKRDHMEIDRSPFPFRGDNLPQGPPLAWTTIWRDTYSNFYGWYIPDAMRKWGYVFWDAATLNWTGAMQVLERQWEEAWQGKDPRDAHTETRKRLR